MLSNSKRRLARKKLFVNRTRGCETPEQKAEALKRHCHIISIVNDPVSGGIIKYYSLEYFDVLDKVTEVTYIGNRVVSVRNVPANIVKTVPPVNAPKFGAF